MKRSIFILFSVALASVLRAQEYRVPVSSGKLQIMDVNQVVIEGHTGSDIIFTSTSSSRNGDERAKGLRAVSSLGLEDNSGLGVSVVRKGDVIEVRQLKKTEGPKLKIQVPKGVSVSYSHSSPFGQPVHIRNFGGDVEVNTTHNGVRIENSGGRLSVKTVHGDIDAILANIPATPVSLESVHGHVDVALPAGSNVDLSLRTEWGEMLVDPDFEIEFNAPSGELTHYSDRISVKLNGGGPQVKLASDHNNVYLRKK